MEGVEAVGVPEAAQVEAVAVQARPRHQVGRPFDNNPLSFSFFDGIM